MDEKKDFIEEWKRQEVSLAELCRGYGISRQTGYKWVERYELEGESGLEEHSRAPLQHPQAMLPEVSRALMSLRSEHPSWGPRKLRAYLQRDTPKIVWPAASSIGDLLHREGLAHPRRTRKPDTAVYPAAAACRSTESGLVRGLQRMVSHPGWRSL
jgi:putative transposase